MACASGDVEDATRLQRRAVEQTRDPGELVPALSRLASYRRQAGAGEEAAELLRATIREGDKLRAEVRLPREADGLQARLARIYRQLADLHLDAGRIQEAFAASEDGRAVLLARRLAGREPRGAGDAGESTGGRALGASALLKVLSQLGERSVLISWVITSGRLATFVLRADDQSVHAECTAVSDDEL
jgi:hypothetical protein